MKYDLQKQEQHAQEQIRRNPPFENAYTIEVDRVRAENKEFIEENKRRAEALRQAVAIALGVQEWKQALNTKKHGIVSL